MVCRYQKKNHEERTINQVYCHAVISQHVLHLTFLPLFSPPLSTPADVISLGRPEEDQRVVLGLGGHVTLHQHQPAMVARRAQRLGLLRLLGASPGGRSESQPLHGHQRRPHLRKTCRWERMTQQRERETARGGCGWRNVKVRWPQFIFGSVKLRSDCLSLSLCPAAQGVHRVRVLVPVRRPALYAPAAPTAPARPWSACGAAARSAASTPRPTSSPSPTDSVWSGRPRTVAVRGGGGNQTGGGWQTCTTLVSGLWMCFHTNVESRTEQTLYWRSTSWITFHGLHQEIVFKP